jgi:hypothetical protein
LSSCFISLSGTTLTSSTTTKVRLVIPVCLWRTSYR